jgi:hypothetical protein
MAKTMKSSRQHLKRTKNLDSIAHHYLPALIWGFAIAFLALPLLTNAGQSRTRYPQMITYHDDFSMDPGWVSNDPANLRRDPTNNTFHGWQANTATSYAYTPVNWDGKASFELSYDLKLNSCDWSAGVTLGLFGTNLLSSWNQPALLVDVGIGDLGRSIAIFGNNGTQTAVTNSWDLWTTGLWYRFALKYDAVTGLLRLTVLNRDTGLPVVQQSVTINAPFASGLLYLGVSRRFMEGYNNYAVDYNLDNIQLTFLPAYAQDFSMDPGWVSNDPANLRRDPTNNTFHGWQANTATSYAYTPVNWDGKASFELSYDLKLNSCDWSAGVTLGLFGTNLLSSWNQPALLVDVGIGDLGRSIAIFGNNGTQTAVTNSWDLWTTGLWYRFALKYDAVTGLLRLTVLNRDTGLPVVQQSVTINAPFASGLLYLGVSRRFMEGYNNYAVDYNLDNIQLTFLPAYAQDFSMDPGWVSNDPANLRRDPTNNTFHGWQANTATSYAYTPVNWDGKASFELAFDTYFNSCQWSAGLTIGLYDSNLLNNFNQPMMLVDFAEVDGGRRVSIFANSGTTATNASVAVPWQDGVWYHVQLRYDSVLGQMRVTVSNRATGQVINQQSITINVPFIGGLKYLGVSRLFMEGYNSNAVDYNLDNIRFATSIVPPELQAQPQPQLGYWGKTATFTVTGLNFGPFTYQWYHNGILIPNATNVTLTLLDLSLADAGNYRVVVGNSFGSLTSDDANLEISPAAISLKMYAGVIIDGVVGRTYRIERRSDLSQTNVWITMTNLTLTSPVQAWIDPGSAGNPHGFYRVTIP